MRRAIFCLFFSIARWAGAQTGADAPPFPPPGRLVDVGGWRLHLHCTGEARPGQPTVILETGVGDFSVEWSLVQSKVASFARVCSYDRAGDGWSDVGPHPRTMRQVVYELHTLLEKADVRPPYVLVGHSYGAWLVRVFASTYLKETAGMVLVDGGYDNPVRIIGGKRMRSSDLATGKEIPAVKTSGPLRETDIPATAMAQMKAGAASLPLNDGPRTKLPADAQRMRAWTIPRWQHIAAGVNPFEAEELAALRAERLKGGYPLGDIPVVVMTRGIPEDSGEEERTREHSELLSLSRNSRQVIAAKSGHHIQLDEPELVVAAVRSTMPAAQRRPVQLTLRSSILSEDRRILVRLPRHYDLDPAARFPVLYKFDGDNGLQRYDDAIDVLSSAGAMPDLIVVAIPNGRGMRNRDLTPASLHQDGNEEGTMGTGEMGRGDRFLDFVQQELILWVDKQYRTTPERILAGHSRGALLVLQSLLSKPDLFQARFVFSAPLMRDEQRMIADTRKFLQENRGHKSYLYCNWGEAENQGMNKSHAAMKALLTERAPAGLRWTIERARAADHQQTPLLALPAALHRYFAGRR